MKNLSRSHIDRVLTRRKAEFDDEALHVGRRVAGPLARSKAAKLWAPGVVALRLQKVRKVIRCNVRGPIFCAISLMFEWLQGVPR
jgi:hypothetical protein